MPSKNKQKRIEQLYPRVRARVEAIPDQRRFVVEHMMRQLGCTKDELIVVLGRLNREGLVYRDRERERQAARFTPEEWFPTIYVRR